MENPLVALRERLAGAGLSAVIITHPSNRFYLSGYAAEDIPPNESAGHLVITAERAVLVTSPLETERARLQAPNFEIFDKVRPLAKADAVWLTEAGVQGRVGFEENAILYRDFTTLNDELGAAIQLTPVGDLVDNLRAVKSPEEIRRIARAIEITDLAFERVAADIEPGDSERAIAWRLDSAMRELGAEGPAFPTIVASGPNSALPHYQPGDRPIEPGEPVVIDMGALVDGYCGDLTRTIWVGEPNDLVREIYPIVQRANEAATAAIKAGMSTREADAVARDIITEAGYGEYFNHSLGHGIGVRVHEAPSLSPRSDETLAEGQVVTIEPGIYIPGRGGVRIEDVAVITDDGNEVLTTARKQWLSRQR